jgi:ABC-type transport system involved in multi-copper enzyme maturation permease subunit
MFRKTLALLVRALRVDARSIRPHLIRLGLLATILWLLYIASAGASFLGAPGLQLFSMLTRVNTWFITIVGVSYFASAITEEKEERTLGLLRMADIGGGSILLGKWLPRIIGMLSLIVVQFPFTLLSITLGGVTLSQVTAVYLALLLHLLSVGTYSLLASVYCRNTGSAVRLAFIAIFLRWLLPTLAGELAASTNSLVGSGNEWLESIASLNQASIYSLTDRALATTFADTPFPPAAAWWLAESGLMFALAWLLFEPCTRGDVMSDAQPAIWARWMTRKTRTNHRRAWTAALAGKDFILLGGGLRGSMLRFAAYVGVMFLFIGIMAIGGGRMSASDLGGSLFGFGIGFLVLDVVQSAAKIFRVELQDQTWSALMMLPRGLNNIAWSKIGGCAIAWWPSLTMIFLGGLLVPSAVSSIVDALTHPETFFGLLYFVLQVVLFLELTVLTSISLTWAAWPLAAPLSFFAVLLSNSLLFTCLLTSLSSSGGSDAIQVIFFLLSGVSTVIAGVLYQRIGARLTMKAADGS